MEYDKCILLLFMQETLLTPYTPLGIVNEPDLMNEVCKFVHDSLTRWFSDDNLPNKMHVKKVITDTVINNVGLLNFD